MAYESDPILLEKWHVIAGSGLDKCIAQTVSDLSACTSIRFYVVTEDSQFVGYFATEFDGAYMPTIFIHPKYRHRKAEFWKLVEAKTLPEWNAGIYAKNIPCKKFYEKMGKVISEIQAPLGAAVIFGFSRSESCR